MYRTTALAILAALLVGAPAHAADESAFCSVAEDATTECLPQTADEDAGTFDINDRIYLNFDYDPDGGITSDFCKIVWSFDHSGNWLFQSQTALDLNSGEEIQSQQSVLQPADIEDCTTCLYRATVTFKATHGTTPSLVADESEVQLEYKAGVGMDSEYTAFHLVKAEIYEWDGTDCTDLVKTESGGPKVFYDSVGMDDTDGDGVDDPIDNCLSDDNGPTQNIRSCDQDPQLDADGDGYGNACDTDFNNDGATGLDDRSAVLTCANDNACNGTVPATFEEVYDVNCDGAVGLDDVSITAGDAIAVKTPGPSGLDCQGLDNCEPWE